MAKGIRINREHLPEGRGIKAWYGQAFVVDGTTAMLGGTCPEAQFDPLQGAERYPEKSVITGWDDF